MKVKHSYYLARTLIIITGIIFIIQFIFEGFFTRKPGFEWIIYVCGAAFLLALIYGFILIILNLRILKEDLKNIPCICCYYYTRGKICSHIKSIKSEDIVTGQKFYYDCNHMRSNLCGEGAKLFKKRKLWQKLLGT